MKVKTNFKQMYLVDNILYNKLNQHSTKPYLISSNVSQTPPTITFQPPPTFQPPTPIKDNVLQDNPQSFETKFEPAKQDTASPLKTTTEPHVQNKVPSVPENLSNAKPFELEANRYLDNLEKEYKPYTHEQPAQQPTALEFNEPKQLAVSKHDSSKQLLSKYTPVIQTNTSQQVRPLALPQPMEYQQSLPALKQYEVMQVDDECKECDLSNPPTNPSLPPPSYPALPPTNLALPPQPSYPLLPSTYSAHPSITPSNSGLALLTPRPTLPSTYPALPPPSSYPALPPPYPPPPTYPVLQSPFTYPAQTSLTPSNSKLALPAPTLTPPTSITNPTSTVPALPPPKLALPSPVKYEVYTKSKQIPTLMSYICSRCNTSFKKKSSLINHNERFHHAFNQTVKGVKRLSKDEITHLEKKIPKIERSKRKQIQHLNKQMLTYEPYSQST